jgi:hypothetical protein
MRLEKFNNEKLHNLLSSQYTIMLISSGGGEAGRVVLHVIYMHILYGFKPVISCVIKLKSFLLGYIVVIFLHMQTIVITQNYWVSGLCPSSRNLEVRRFRKWIYFRPQVWG